MTEPNATVFTYGEVDWDDPLSSLDPSQRPPAAIVKKARESGARRKKVVRGERGFFMNRSVMPAGFRVPPHNHDHDELIVCLAGSCEFDDGLGALGPDDSIVIGAGTTYGFTCGDDGMEFLTIRTGEAKVALTGAE